MGKKDYYLYKAYALPTGTKFEIGALTEGSRAKRLVIPNHSGYFPGGPFARGKEISVPFGIMAFQYISHGQLMYESRAKEIYALLKTEQGAQGKIHKTYVCPAKVKNYHFGKDVADYDNFEPCALCDILYVTDGFITTEEIFDFLWRKKDVFAYEEIHFLSCRKRVQSCEIV